jgi:hypothetical protein
MKHVSVEFCEEGGPEDALRYAILDYSNSFAAATNSESAI